MAKHGTRTSYLAGCRCDSCRSAQSAYRKDLAARKKAKAAGQPATACSSVERLAAVRPIQPAQPATPAVPTAPPTKGPVETGVDKQLANLAGTDLQPGLAEVARAMARILDDPTARSQQPAAAARLAESLTTLGKAGRRQKGRLAAVQEMTTG